MTTTNLVLRLLITWIVPGGLAILIGVKKNRVEFGVLMGLLFGALGFFFGLGLGWLGMIVVCCFKKRQIRDSDPKMRTVASLTFALMFAVPSFADIPDSRYQYAADGEYSDLEFVSPWIGSKVSDYNVEFKYPKCAEAQPVDRRYSESMLFNGTVKLVFDTVVCVFAVSVFNNTPEFDREMKKILSATDKEIASPDYIKTIASLAGRKDVLEIGMEKVGGHNAFYSTTKMERRVGGEIVYRGVQRVYLIPMRDGKTVLSANYGVGVLGAEEVPYSDFKAFKPVGDKFIRSLVIKGKSKWKFW